MKVDEGALEARRIPYSSTRRRAEARSRTDVTWSTMWIYVGARAPESGRSFSYCPDTVIVQDTDIHPTPLLMVAPLVDSYFGPFLPPHHHHRAELTPIEWEHPPAR